MGACRLVCRLICRPFTRFNSHIDLRKMVRVLAILQMLSVNHTICAALLTSYRRVQDLFHHPRVSVAASLGFALQINTPNPSCGRCILFTEEWLHDEPPLPAVLASCVRAAV